MSLHTMAEISKMNLDCPACQALNRSGKLVPMFKVAGLRCDTAGNYWNKFKKSWSVCGFTVYFKSPPDAPAGHYLLRPTEFPKIKTPTYEQQPVRNWFGSAPKSKGTRLLLVNAGPGCGKTSTVSWSAEAAWQRLGDLNYFEFVAFNRNAKDVFMTKLPYQVPGIYTMNGLGMRMQGYKSDDIDDSKIYRIFSNLVEEIHPDHRPDFDGIDELIERMRAFGLYADPSNENWWKEAIGTTVERFHMLEGKKNPQEVLELWCKYVPIISKIALDNGKNIDLSEQWSRAVTVAMAKYNLSLPADVASRDFEMDDEFIKQAAEICRKVELPEPVGLTIDEGQDLCLGQILFFLASAYRKSEVIVIGDDKCGNPGEDGYKTGQGIYGWRGAFGGSMKLIGKLWQELTGETATELPLSITFRSAPEVVHAINRLNTTLKSAKPEGSGFAYSTPIQTAFAVWCGMPEEVEGKPLTAFWITRTNRASGEVFMKSIKARIPVGFRGGNGFEKSLDAILYNATADEDKKKERVGRDFKTGEYPGVNIMDARTRLEKKVQQTAAQSEERAADMLEQFLVSVIDEMIADPTVLQQVQGLPHQEVTLGNLRRFLLAFADKNATRIVSNVYRVKGDEAEWVFVSDCEQFNKPWGGDEDEAAACRLVACSRAATGLFVCGALAGVDADPLNDEEMEKIPQTEEKRAVTYQKEKFKRQLGKVRLKKVSAGNYTWLNYEVKQEPSKLWYVHNKDKEGTAAVSGPFKSMDECRKFLEKA